MDEKCRKLIIVILISSLCFACNLFALDKSDINTLAKIKTGTIDQYKDRLICDTNIDDGNISFWRDVQNGIDRNITKNMNASFWYYLDQKYNSEEKCVISIIKNVQVRFEKKQYAESYNILKDLLQTGKIAHIKHNQSIYALYGMSLLLQENSNYKELHECFYNINHIAKKGNDTLANIMLRLQLRLLNLAIPRLKLEQWDICYRELAPLLDGVILYESTLRDIEYFVLSDANLKESQREEILNDLMLFLTNRSSLRDINEIRIAHYSMTNDIENRNAALRLNIAICLNDKKKLAKEIREYKKYNKLELIPNAIFSGTYSKESNKNIFVSDSLRNNAISEIKRVNLESLSLKQRAWIYSCAKQYDNMCEEIVHIFSDMPEDKLFATFVDSWILFLVESNNIINIVNNDKFIELIKCIAEDDHKIKSISKCEFAIDPMKIKTIFEGLSINLIKEHEYHLFEVTLFESIKIAQYIQINDEKFYQSLQNLLFAIKNKDFIYAIANRVRQNKVYIENSDKMLLVLVSVLNDKGMSNKVIDLIDGISKNMLNDTDKVIFSIHAAVANIQVGDIEKAKKVLDDSVKSATANSQIYFLLGWAYMYNNNIDDAIQCYTTLIDNYAICKYAGKARVILSKLEAIPKN